MAYTSSENRKSKNDKKAKGRYNKYKKGGRFRSIKIKETANRNN
jgi:hypothetical protein